MNSTVRSKALLLQTLYKNVYKKETKDIIAKNEKEYTKIEIGSVEIKTFSRQSTANSNIKETSKKSQKSQTDKPDISSFIKLMDNGDDCSVLFYDRNIGFYDYPNSLLNFVVAYLKHTGQAFTEKNFTKSTIALCSYFINEYNKDNKDNKDMKYITHIKKALEKAKWSEAQAKRNNDHYSTGHFRKVYSGVPVGTNYVELVCAQIDAKYNAGSMHFAKMHKIFEYDKHIKLLNCVYKKMITSSTVSDKRGAEVSGKIFAKIDDLEKKKRKVFFNLNDDWQPAKPSEFQVLIDQDDSNKNKSVTLDKYVKKFLKNHCEKEIKEWILKKDQLCTNDFDKNFKTLSQIAHCNAAYEIYNSEERLNSYQDVVELKAPRGFKELKITIKEEHSKANPAVFRYVKNVDPDLLNNSSVSLINSFSSSIKISANEVNNYLPEKIDSDELKTLHTGAVSTPEQAKEYVDAMIAAANQENVKVITLIDNRLLYDIASWIPGGERKLLNNHHKLIKDEIEQRNAKIKARNKEIENESNENQVGKKLLEPEIRILFFNAARKFSNIELNRESLINLVGIMEEKSIQIKDRQFNEYLEKFKYVIKYNDYDLFTGEKGYLFGSMLNYVSNKLGAAYNEACKSNKDRASDIRIVNAIDGYLSWEYQTALKSKPEYKDDNLSPWEKLLKKIDSSDLTQEAKLCEISRIKDNILKILQHNTSALTTYYNTGSSGNINYEVIKNMLIGYGFPQEMIKIVLGGVSPYKKS